jgi:hypothetical protein
MKILNTVEPKDYTKKIGNKNHQVYLNVVGIFDSVSMNWKYYVISTVDNYKIMTNDIKDFQNGSTYCETDIYHISSKGRFFSTQEEAEQYINEFKMRWEYATNDTLQEIRDQKLKSLTDEK